MVLGLLWCNVGIAAEREPGTDKKCFYQFEKAKVLEKKFLPKVNKDQGVFVTYVGCINIMTIGVGIILLIKT